MFVDEKCRGNRISQKLINFACEYLKEIGFNKVYYTVRYSGIVQSVEQRTVNPYVTGSSPVARAKNFPVFRDFLLLFSKSHRLQNLPENDRILVNICFIQV